MHALLSLEELKIVCRVCKVEKPTTEFNKSKVCRYGVTKTCKECRSAWYKTYYSKNKKKHQASANTRNRNSKLALVEYFGNKCHDCGQSFHQCVYDFHHIDESDKVTNPSTALKWGEEKKLAELSKCVMLCANCHRIRHFAEKD